MNVEKFVDTAVIRPKSPLQKDDCLFCRGTSVRELHLEITKVHSIALRICESAKCKEIARQRMIDMLSGPPKRKKKG